MDNSIILNKEFEVPFLTNTRLFCDEALHFLKNGYYTNALEGTYLYEEYWNEQTRRCLEGYSVGGTRITGLHYFYLNFYQIRATVDHGKIKRKILTFPRFLDMDYLYFHEIEQAQLNGQGLIVAKARRKGFSFKNSALVVHQYSFFRDSTSIIGAYLNEYAESTMSMALEAINFINANTAWYKRRNPDTRDFIKARFEEIEDGRKVWKGYNSEIYTLTFKDNFSAAIGKSASIFLFEEAGKWDGLINSYMVTAPCFRDGDYMIGFPFIFGCVCAGTKVWNNLGQCINIEDLKQEEGIIGYGGIGALKQAIMQKIPVAKKPCYRIETANNEFIECSDDHPLLWSQRDWYKYKGKIKDRKKVTFKRAKDIKVGDQLMQVRQNPIFGPLKMWNPRLIGLLVGDGNYTKDATPQLSIGDDDIYDWLIKQNLKTSIYKTKTKKDGGTYRSVGILGIQDALKALGIYGQSNELKHLPDHSEMYDQYSIAEMLGGYFDADGNVYYNKKKNCTRIVLTSKHAHLLEEVKVLLYKFGVGCAIRKEYRKDGYKPGDIYRLYVSRTEDVIEFKKHISFICKHKQKTLEEIDTTKTVQCTFDNCLFEMNPENGKGEFLLAHNELNHLQSCYVKSVEYIGEKEVYNINTSHSHTYITNKFISANTGGDAMGSSSDFCEMFYNPEKYWLRAYDNIYDEGAEGNSCGLFINDTWYKPGKIILQKDKIDLGVYQDLMPLFTKATKDETITIDMVDDDGNSNRPVVNYYLDLERERIKKSDSKSTWEKYITQSPKTPKEAFLRTSGNLFPTVELSRWLGELETDKRARSLSMIGDLYWEGSTVKWKPNPNLNPITRFPIKNGDNSEGCVVIYEHPFRNEQGEIPYGLYIGGTDPYDHDKSGTTSLGSTFIYKTFQKFDKTYQIVVAEYTARPALANIYNDTLIKLLTYYNAKTLYENNLKGLKIYFEQKKTLHLLKEQPRILKDIVKDSQVLRGYGCNMNEAIKRQIEIYIRDWLLTKKADTGEGEVERYNYHSIYSIPLLQELIAYDSKQGNFDRCFKKDTLITTDKGFVPIQDICVNDNVLTHNNRFMPVTCTSKHMPIENKLLNIKVKSIYEELNTTGEHPFLVKRVNRKGRRKHLVTKDLLLPANWIKAKELLKDDLLLLPKRNIQSSIDLSEDLLYMLGWYLSDGNVSNTCNKVRFCMQGDQKIMAYKIKRIIDEFIEGEYLPGRMFHTCQIIEYPQEKYCYYVEISSKKLKDFILHYCGEAHNKYLRTNLYNNNNLLPLVLGFFEGDGHQKTDKLGRNIIEVCGIHELLLKQIRQLLLDNGIYNSICIKNKHSKRKLQYSISISGQYVNKLVPNSLKFKPKEITTYNKTFGFETEEGFWVPIKSINEIEHNEEVYNFSVEEDETYTASGIITHNCIAFGLCILHENENYQVNLSATKEKKHKDAFWNQNSNFHKINMSGRLNAFG